MNAFLMNELRSSRELHKTEYGLCDFGNRNLTFPQSNDSCSRQPSVSCTLWKFWIPALRWNSGILSGNCLILLPNGPDVRDGSMTWGLSLHLSASVLVSLSDVVKWRHSNLCLVCSRYDLHVVGHDVVLCEGNWWRFVTKKTEPVGLRKA